MTVSTQEAGTRLGRGWRRVVTLLERGADLGFRGARDGIRSARLARYVAESALEAGLTQPTSAALEAQRLLVGSVLETLKGEKRARDLLRETADRVKSGARFADLTTRLGKELFGTATYPGELTLAEDAHLKLTYIPPAEGKGEPPFILFHAGGGIPYGDALFRFLPEANFFERFRERGIPVYAMEWRGDRHRVDVSGLTMARLIDAIERFSQRAFEHAGKRRMVLEGYCGHGMQALAYAAARPEDAEAKFDAVALFVAPVDGTQGADLADMMERVPEPLLDTSLWLWGKLGGYVPIDSLRGGLDMSLGTAFQKSPVGQFFSGWKQPSYAGVDRLVDLTPAQRKELAGAYWLSRENGDRFAIPVDLARFAGRLFTRGIGAKGEIPWTHDGKALSLRELAARTRLEVVGLYGGKDAVVQDRSAFALMGAFGKRYTHVVHPDAGHVSYILSPGLWSGARPGALDPNPIDVLAGAARRGAAARGDAAPRV